MPCPCSEIQALFDPDYGVSVDFRFNRINRRGLQSFYRAALTTEWEFDIGIYICMFYVCLALN